MADGNTRDTKDSWFRLNQQLGDAIGRRHPRELKEVIKETDLSLKSTFYFLFLDDLNGLQKVDWNMKLIQESLVLKLFGF